MDKNKMLNDFLPDKIFDAHMHLYDKSFMEPTTSMPGSVNLEDFHLAMKSTFSNREISANIIPYPSKKVISNDKDYLKIADDFLFSELKKDSNNVGELLVMPNENREHILSRIKSEQICGFKCYCSFSPSKETINLNIVDYLPESAFEIANEYRKVITLHLVKENSLSDKNNLNYIIKMTKKYPNAILILAHAARSFASWTGFESVHHLKDLDNVYYDFSAVCEVPTMLQIIKTCGINKVMWGSDYPITERKGRAISLADKFYWLEELNHPEIASNINMWKFIEESLMAVRQTAILADLSTTQIEDLFYNNAINLFGSSKKFNL